jgi:hypothetical protein
MRQQRIHHQEEPPAYSYGEGSYLTDNYDPPVRHTTMRLLPTSSQVESDLNADLGTASTYRDRDPFGDDNQ